MVIQLLVVVAFDLVEPELDVRDFAGDGVDGGERPAGEVAHRLGGVDVLGAGGLVDGERVVAERFQTSVDVGDFGFAGAATVAHHDLAGCGDTLKTIGLKFGTFATKYRGKVGHRLALIVACKLSPLSAVGILRHLGFVNLIRSYFTWRSNRE